MPEVTTLAELCPGPRDADTRSGAPSAPQRDSGGLVLILHSRWTGSPGPWFKLRLPVGLLSDVSPPPDSHHDNRDMDRQKLTPVCVGWGWGRRVLQEVEVVQVTSWMFLVISFQDLD